MSLIVKWVLPIAFCAIGIAILAGWMFPNLPAGTGLRATMGAVVILLGVHRFFASRIVKANDRRPYGGERPKPWEDEQ